MRTDEITQTVQTILNENFKDSPPIDVKEIALLYDGITIEERLFPPKFADLSGFIVIVDGLPKIVVNAADSNNRKRFTVAHEFGHWMLHKDKLRNDPEISMLPRRPLGRANSDPIEREANMFAAQILVPDSMLTEDMLAKSKTQLAKIFNVSEDVIGYRLQDIQHQHIQNSAENESPTD